MSRQAYQKLCEESPSGVKPPQYLMRDMGACVGKQINR